MHHGDGYGLGLATADLIMKKLGGTIEIGNIPESGATVRISLPIEFIS